MSATSQIERPQPSWTNEIWATNFVLDTSLNGKRFQALTVVGTYTRECLAIHVD